MLAWRAVLLLLPLLRQLSLQVAWQQGPCWLQTPLPLKEGCQLLPPLLQLPLHCFLSQMTQHCQLAFPLHCCCCCCWRREPLRAGLLLLLLLLAAASQGWHCLQTALEQWVMWRAAAALPLLMGQGSQHLLLVRCLALQQLQARKLCLPCLLLQPQL